MQSRFEAFSKKHSRLLIFIGAFIVFITFVVKEGLRERWKETAEALEMAQYVYSIRVDTGQDAIRYDSLLNAVSRLSSVSSSAKKDLEDKRAQYLWERRDEDQRELDSIDLSLANISMLINKSGEGSYKNKLAVFNGEVSKAKEEISFLDEAPKNEGEYATWTYYASKKPHDLIDNIWIGPRSRNSFKKGHSSIGRAHLLMLSMRELEFDINGFIKGVLKNAETVRQKNDHLSKYAWWISAFLFAVGWGLGLLGKLYGVPEAAVEQ